MNPIHMHDYRAEIERRVRLNNRRRDLADRIGIALVLAAAALCLWLLPAAIEYALVMR